MPLLKRLIIILITLALLSTSVANAASSVFAQSPSPAAQAKPGLNVFEGPNAGDFKTLNPLEMFASPYKDDLTSPAGIINRILLFAFPLAGLILFVMLIWGGFEMVMGATNKKGMEQARQRVTSAIMGFGLLFISFWIIQLMEYIFNLAIL